jgi:hypothetical protein
VDLNKNQISGTFHCVAITSELPPIATLGDSFVLSLATHKVS